MGIPKKKSRPVDVDGQLFRFMVKEVHIPDHPDQRELSVTIQEDHERPGCILQFRLPYGYPVGPEGIRYAVRQAKKSGWDPHARGGPFDLKAFRHP